MKKLLLLFISMIEAAGGYAQLSINPEAGINFSTAVSKNDNLKTDSKYRIGYKAGALVDISIYNGVYIEPGIFYTVKGVTLNTSAVGVLSENKITLNYLEVPINIGYKYNFDKAGAMFVFAGPYWGIGLNGKNESHTNGMSAENDIKFGHKVTDEFIKADFGLNVGAGYVLLSGLYFRLQYGAGLCNISNVENTSWKNRAWSASLGYTFKMAKG